MSKQAIASVVVSLLLGLLVAACGDEDSDADGGTGTVSANGSAIASDDGPAIARAEFVKQANAACAKSVGKASSEVADAYDNAKVKGASTEQEAIDLEVSIFVPILLGAAEAQAEKIRALGMPSGDEDQVNAILEAYDDWIEKAQGTPLKVVIGNDVYNDARELAGEYGLAACGKSPFEA